MTSVFELLQQLDIQSMSLVTLLRPSRKKILGKVQQMSTAGSGGVTLVISDVYHVRHKVDLSGEIMSISGEDEPLKVTWVDGSILAQGDMPRRVEKEPQLAWNVLLPVTELADNQTLLYFDEHGTGDYSRNMIIATMAAIAAHSHMWVTVRYTDFMEVLTRNPWVITGTQRGIIEALFDMAKEGDLEIVRVGGDEGDLWIIPSQNLAMEALGDANCLSAVPLRLA